MNFNEIKIPQIEDKEVVVKGEKFEFSITALINLLIDFINKIIAFEF